MNKLVTESGLLLLIGLIDVHMVLGNYTKILDEKYPIKQEIIRVAEEMVGGVEVSNSAVVKSNVIHSDTIYVRFDDGKVAYFMTFNDKEMELLVTVANKLGQERFTAFMKQCTDKTEFMAQVMSVLKSDNRIALR